MKTVTDIYQELANEHGVGTYRGVGWSSKEIQEVRFQVLLDGLSDLWSNSVLDVGCGTGELINALDFYKKVGSYTGIDLVEDNIRFAEKQHSDEYFTFYKANILDEDNVEELHRYEYDYVLASGLFSYYKPWQISRAVCNMWGLAEKGLLFNVRVPHTLPSFNDLLTVLKVAGVESWTMRHDYMTEDVTVYAWKDKGRV